MTRRNRGPRAGFTLIEILLVVAIIALLAAMLLPAIGKVREGARRSECATDMAQVANAVQAFKTKFNVNYIPAAFVVETNYQDASSNAASRLYLRSVFPYINDLNTGLVTAGGYTEGQVLDANQTLVLFLTGGRATGYQGFSTNKQQPFTLAANSDPIGPFIDIKATKLDPEGRYIDPWGTPYQYFTSVPGQGINNYTAGAYHQNGKYLNAKSFQIISAGADQIFATCPPPNAGPPVEPGWTPGAGQWENTQPGADDMSNFNNGPLVAQE